MIAALEGLKTSCVISAHVSAPNATFNIVLKSQIQNAVSTLKLRSLPLQDCVEKPPAPCDGYTLVDERPLGRLRLYLSRAPKFHSYFLRSV